MAVPLPPGSLTGTFAARRALLSWARAAGADSYNIKRGTAPGGPYTTVGSVPATSRRILPVPTTSTFMDAGLTNGTAYYYVVTSVIGGVESAPSSEFSITPLGIPTAPTSVSATPSDEAVALSWASSFGATGYKVWRSLTHGGPYTLLTSQGGTTYDDTGLTNGTTYYYAISAVGASGEGSFSDEASATPSGSVSTMTTAKRTSGMAPLSVFFDAVDTAGDWPWSSGVEQPVGGDFPGFNYTWDFGDGASGSWTSDGRSKNQAIGFTTGHVYESTGTYVVTLTILKPDDTVVVYQETITVSAWSGSDRYVSSSTGNDSNDGLTSGTAWASLAKVFANLATNRRFLFKRGDTFLTSTGNFNLNIAGPGLFTTYGSGALPIFQSTNTSNPLITVNANDWRFWNIDMLGPGASDPQGAISLSNSVQINNTLIYGCIGRSWRVPFGNFDSAPIYATPSSETMIAGCTVDDPQVNGVFIGGQNLAVIGNIIQNCVTSHLLRVWMAYKGVVSNNLLDNPGGDRHNLKLHGRHEAGHPPTKYVNVSYNKFRRGHAWNNPIGPEDTVTGAEIVEDVICDSNDCVANPDGTVQVCFKIEAVRVTVRNNWMVQTNSKYCSLVMVTRNPLVPQATGIKVYNNTVYKADSQSGNEIDIVLLETTDIGTVEVRNNQIWAPNVASARVVTGTCAGLVQDHNDKDNNPLFQNAAANNFHLSPGSPALDAGVQSDYVRKDYDGVDRPLVAAPDLGAYQLVS